MFSGSKNMKKQFETDLTIDNIPMLYKLVPQLLKQYVFKHTLVDLLPNMAN